MGNASHSCSPLSFLSQTQDRNGRAVAGQLGTLLVGRKRDRQAFLSLATILHGLSLSSVGLNGEDADVSPSRAEF